MLALGPAERRALIGAALCAFVGAFALVPSQARGRLGPHIAAVPSPPAAAAEPSDVLPARDPFAPALVDADAVRTPPPVAHLAPLPPNAGAGPFPFASAPPPAQLLATVSGPEPRAIVDERGRTRFVGIGEPFAGTRIAAIDAGGIRLDDGRRISLTTAAPENRP